jgi:hypothetical protein
MTTIGEYEELFTFAAKAGSLEGYLYERERVEPLHDWVSNTEKMYAGLFDNIKDEIRGEFGSVLARISTYGERVLGDTMKKRPNDLLSEL